MPLDIHQDRPGLQARLISACGLVLFLLGAISARAQNIQPHWVAHPSILSEDSNDKTVDARITEDGHAYLVGLRNRVPFGTATVLIKLDESGSEIWKVSLDGPPSTKALTLEVDSHGDPYVLARVHDSNDEFAVHVIKYAGETGGILWDRKFEDWNATDKLAVDASNRTFLELWRSDADGAISCLVALDKNGKDVWSRTSTYNSTLVFAPDEEGGLFAVFGSIIHEPEIRRYMHISHILVDGRQEWTREIPTPNRYARPRLLAMAGDLYVAGTAHGLFYARIETETGQTVSTGHHPDGTWATGLAVDSSGAAYVTGHDTAYRTCKDECPDDFITVKFDTFGSVAWSARHDGVNLGREYPTSIVLAAEGSVVVSGVSGDVTTISYDAATGMQRWISRQAGQSPILTTYPSGELFLAWESRAHRHWLTDLSAARISIDDATPRWRFNFDGPTRPRDSIRAFGVDEDGNVTVANDSCQILRMDADGRMQFSFDVGAAAGNECRIETVLPRSDGSVAFVATVAPKDPWQPASTDVTTGLLESDGGLAWIQEFDSPRNTRNVGTVAANAEDGLVVLSSNLIDGHYEILGVRYDSDGRERWRTRIHPQDANSTHPRRAFVDRDRVFILGAVESDVGYDDVAVVSLSDETGDVLWIQTVGGTANKSDAPIGLVPGMDGSVVAVLASHDSVDAGTVVDRNVLVNFDPGGEKAWTSQFEGYYPAGVAGGPDGQVFVASISRRSFLDDTGMSYDNDMTYHVHAFDGSGSALWEFRTSTGSGTFMNPPTLLYREPDVWVIGSEHHPVADHRAASAMVIGSSGELRGRFWLWPDTYPIFRLHGLEFDGSGNLYVAGRLDLTPVVAKYDVSSLPVAIEATETPGRLAIDQAYPNPARDNFDIPFTLTKPAEVELVIVDVVGRTVYQTGSEMRLPGTSSVSVDASNLSSGAYLYILRIGDNRHSGSVVIVK